MSNLMFRSFSGMNVKVIAFNTSIHPSEVLTLKKETHIK